MTEHTGRAIGGASNVSRLVSVLVKDPRDAFATAGPDQWQVLNWTGAPDPELAARQHDAFVALLEADGAEVHRLPSDPAAGLDSIYVHDAMIITERGAVLCRMGKPGGGRDGEPGACERWCELSGIPVLGRIESPGRLEGGDLIWLDDRTVAVGEGYRTNAEGIRQLAELLGDLVDRVVPVPLPHWTGPGDCLHLMSLISPVDRDLAVVYSPLLPVPFRQALLDAGIELVEVPEEEFPTMGANVLATGPRRCIMLDGNPVTRSRLEAAGATVRTCQGSEISHKGAGGPTCLTRPILRRV